MRRRNEGIFLEWNEEVMILPKHAFDFPFKKALLGAEITKIHWILVSLVFVRENL
jgi:hypothetical protein